MDLEPNKGQKPQKANATKLITDDSLSYPEKYRNDPTSYKLQHSYCAPKNHKLKIIPNNNQICDENKEVKYEGIKPYLKSTTNKN